MTRLPLLRSALHLILEKRATPVLVLALIGCSRDAQVRMSAESSPAREPALTSESAAPLRAWKGISPVLRDNAAALVFAKFRNDGAPTGLRAPHSNPGYLPGPRLVLGVWSDGTVVKSANGPHGGQPYSRFRIDEVAAVERELAGVCDEAKKLERTWHLDLHADWWTLQVPQADAWVILESVIAFPQTGSPRRNQSGTMPVLDAADAAKFERATSEDFKRFESCWLAFSLCVERAIEGREGEPFDVAALAWIEVERVTR